MVGSISPAPVVPPNPSELPSETPHTAAKGKPPLESSNGAPIRCSAVVGSMMDKLLTTAERNYGPAQVFNLYFRNPGVTCTMSLTRATLLRTIEARRFSALECQPVHHRVSEAGHGRAALDLEIERDNDNNHDDWRDV